MPALRKPAALIALLCVTEVLLVLPSSAFPALLPQFQALWGLSNGEAGWVSGAYYLGYVLAVPFLVALTDSRDARSIYLWSAALTAAATFAFALLAEGFWVALLCRLAGGIGLAGGYMVGLRILTDRTEGRTRTRAIAFYTAHFGIGNAVAVWFAGLLGRRFDPQAPFLAAGIASMLALLLAWGLIAPAARRTAAIPWRRALDLRPALRNRRALGFNLAYACHGWETFAFRTFLVSFLVFVLASRSEGLPLGLAATDVASLILLLGLPASVLGSELSHYLSRERVIAGIMLSSAAIALLLPWLAAGPLWLLLLVLAAYGMTTMGESALLTSGAFEVADPQRRGATMAVHTILGFAVAVPSPVVFGYLMDLGGGAGATVAWCLGFGGLAVGVALGPLLMRLLARPRVAAAAE